MKFGSGQDNNRKRILIVDDERSVRESLMLLLQDSFCIDMAQSGKEALKKIESNKPDMIFLDVYMPELDGIDTLRKIKKNNSNVPIVMLSGSNTIKTAVEAMKLGALDYINKPFDIEELTKLIINTLAIDTEGSPGEVEETSTNQIIASCKEMLEILDKVSKISLHTTNVLITGDSGTGKELIAKKIHLLSDRASQNFVAINCAAIPENLIESELFGYEKGSFTGAGDRKLGLIEKANKGTLFLDEIGELPLHLQVKLLRFLQSQEFYRVGGNELIKVNVRLISATNRNLEKEIQEKRFREDLYYRINVVNLNLPPLKDRDKDIDSLLDFFINKFSEKYSKDFRFLPETREAFKKYEWPGNIRELENTVESICALIDNGDISVSHLPPKLTKAPDINKNSEITSINLSSNSHEDLSSMLDTGKQFEVEMILKALKKTNNVQSKAARLLGISRRMLKYKIDKFGIKIN